MFSLFRSNKNKDKKRGESKMNYGEVQSYKEEERRLGFVPTNQPTNKERYGILIFNYQDGGKVNVTTTDFNDCNWVRRLTKIDSLLANVSNSLGIIYSMLDKTTPVSWGEIVSPLYSPSDLVIEDGVHIVNTNTTQSFISVIQYGQPKPVTRSKRDIIVDTMTELWDKPILEKDIQEVVKAEWKDKYGKMLKPSDFDNTHILNTIKLIVKDPVGIYLRDLSPKQSVQARVDGDLDDYNIRRFIGTYPILVALIVEAKIRGIYE